MKHSLKFVHLTGLLILLVYLLVFATVKTYGQYRPKEFKAYADRATIVTLSVNLGYAGYLLWVKPQTPIHVQRWLNPTLCGVTMGFSFYKAIEYRTKRERMKKNLQIKNHIVR